MAKAEFYNCSHTTSEHRSCAPKVDPPRSQSGDTPNPESRFASSPDFPCNRKGGEESNEIIDDIKWEGSYFSLVLYPTDSFETGVVISITYVSEDAP